MKPFNDGSAANDEFQSANSGLQRGELVRDLLRQRVQVPAIPADSLQRSHLDSLITEALIPRGAVFIEAPCGYGKSHAVISGLNAVSSVGNSVRWASLNAQDNSPSRFLSLIAIVFDLPEAPESNLQTGASFTDALAMMLIALHRKASEHRQVVVLDNLHYLTNPAVVALLQQLVTELPDSLSIVLISRKALPFESHGLELENRFTRLGIEALELSRSETFEFFQPILNNNQLTSVAIDNLYDLTEGWVTPLALYRREITRDGERKPVQETGSVERFLKESVLGGLAPGQQRSLRVMAELELSSDDLYLALEPALPDTGFVPSVAREHGLPLRSVPGRGRWYRLNPLLQEWLKTPVMPGYPERMLLASRWFGHRDQFPEALRYALLSSNIDEVVQIASEGSEALLLGQDTASLLRLRKSLPAGLLERSARLRIVYSWVHAIGGQFRQAKALIDDLSEEDFKEHEARIFALKAFIIRGEGRVGEALEMAERALELGELSPQACLVTQIVRSSALCAAGNFTEAREANRATARLAREAGDSGSEALAVYTHARIELGKGALKHAEQLLRTGLDTAMQELARPARVGETRLQLNLVLVLWHQGRYREADRLLVNCGRHAEQARDLGLLLVMTIRVLMCRVEGRLDDAFVWIGRAERTMHAWQVDESLFVPVLEALKASCWLSQGQIDSAAQAVRKLEPYREAGCVPELFPMMPGLLDCMQVRVDLARGDLVRAREKLEATRGRYKDAIPWGVELHIRLLEAVLIQGDKGPTSSRKVLLAVVTEASQEHFISPFAELRIELQSLIEAHFAQIPEGAFKEDLGRLFRFNAASSPVEELAEPISYREQGVLELIAQGLSNQEIADKLHISLHTVKTHARRINAKLEVKSRTQAIVRARELGLL
ncbi:helix-turn-helix transcriptional regulator [Marinobacter salinexigens]|uniref:Helix-turn-helix transcriptional regulator n=1 Tax=Marinobacter salinexigens TaxID=2919747 RepID=A0A5B0VQ34_9GAMM|nr:LuxR C-terminal-related transcriptional regulator [Marinobacter salinexigens]KAA1176378.1 helix-turn-helix transcriptional regulator [Marinobacter salinexigens]